MKNRIIFPKRTPGYAVVRTTPKVNDGVVNNVLVRKDFSRKVAGSNRIGVLTGKTVSEMIDGYTYVWYEVDAVQPVRNTAIVRRGWVREDVFSFRHDNSDVQRDPRSQRLAYAQSQAKAVQDSVNETAKALSRIDTAIKSGKGRLTVSQRSAIDGIRQQNAVTVARLRAVPGIRVRSRNLAGLRDDGLGIVPVVIVAIVVVAGLVAAFGINQWVQWSTTMKQVEGEATTQRQLIDTYLGIINSPTATNEQKAAAKTQLDNLSKASTERAKKLVDNTAANSFGSQISKALLPIGLVIVGAKVLKLF